MKATLTHFVPVILLSFSLAVSAQDIVFQISAQYESSQVALDSIHFKNFTNNTSLEFNELPDVQDYVINLTTQEIVEPSGIQVFNKSTGFKMLRCVPGELVIACSDEHVTNGIIEIYNINGQMVGQSTLNDAAGKGSISVHAGTNAMFFVKIQSKEVTRVFKGIGAGDRGSLKIYLQKGIPGGTNQLWTKALYQGPDFKVNKGDSVRIMVFKDKLYSTPAFVKVSENNPLVFELFDDLPVDTVSVMDIDLNVYQTVRIGDRWWMAENLRTTHYQNGDEIPDGTGLVDYSEEMEPSYRFAYDDNLENVPVYGRLYTWYAASDRRNICPAGWYLPTSAEWDSLMAHLGGRELAGGKLKEAGTEHWDSPNEGATNESGFTALPAGSKLYYDGSSFLGSDAHWWTSTHSDEHDAWYWFVSSFSSYLMTADPDKRFGFSIRCIKDEGVPGTIPSIITMYASETTETSATVSWRITHEGGTPVTETGIYFGTEPDPHLTGTKVAGAYASSDISLIVQDIQHSTSYYYRAYAINASGEALGNERSFVTIIHSETGNVTDIDGNTYRTVQLWDKWWMAEDLKVTHYSDGTPIPKVEDNTEWNNLTGPGYCWYDNDSANYSATYGAIYNWYAVETGKLCPSGWYVPSDAEWTSLSDRLGGFEYAGGRLKEEGTAHWTEPNTGATDLAGFKALPGGMRRNYGAFNGIGGGAYWWTSSTSQYNQDNAWNRNIGYNRADLTQRADNKRYGFGVRCVKDTASQPTGSVLKINDDEYELEDGILTNNGDYNGDGTYYHSIYLLGTGHKINWETMDTEGSGAVLYLEILSELDTILPGLYPFSTFIRDTVICDSIDVNNDGVFNDDDCLQFVDYSIPEGGTYVSSSWSACDNNTNLNDLEGFRFLSGEATIAIEGDVYTFECNAVGENDEVISAYYRGTLHYYDFNEEEPPPPPAVDYDYDSALSAGYTLLSQLTEQAWLIDGIFCGEYTAPSPDWNNIANKTITSSDAQIAELWNIAYDLVFNANTIIDSVPLTDLNDFTKFAAIGEARALRAYAYFILVSRFGEVPIYPGYSYTQIPRSTVAEVTALIHDDLSYASDYLPGDYGAEKDKVRIDKWGAMALWSKVDLMLGDWTSANLRVEAIMNSAEYAMDLDNKYSTLGSYDNILAYTSIQDMTFQLTYDKGTVVPVAHYTEQLMIAMECALRLDNPTRAGDLYMLLTQTANSTPTLDDIYNVWMDLMQKEGVTLSILKRFDKAGEILVIQEHQTLLPIPQSVIDTNPYMTQNPGY